MEDTLCGASSCVWVPLPQLVPHGISPKRTVVGKSMVLVAKVGI